MPLEDIQNPLVYRNMMVLLEAIKALKAGNERRLNIHFFYDPATGELFYRPPPALSHLKRLTLVLNMDRMEAIWEAKELSSKAQVHLDEMSNVLKKAFSKIERLGQLAHLEWHRAIEQEPKNDILKQAFFDISREEAEQLLLKQPIHTFLLRRDPYALVLQEILRRGLKKSIRCYTLTYLDAEKIVRDHTIVFVNKTWMFYDDDPTLSGPSWGTAADLLESLGLSLKQALQSQKALIF